MKIVKKTPLPHLETLVGSRKSKSNCSLIGLALAGLLLAQPASAAVTVQGWWHYGEIADLYGDSSGNARRFSQAFSRVGSGNAGVGVIPFGCGGPLGTTAFISTNCLYWTPTHADAAGMWNIGYNPPANNYVIECWCLPELPGTLPGNGSWLFGSGSGGGVAFVLTNSVGGGSAGLSGTMFIRAVILGNNLTIGDPWEVDTNRWNHLAIVNDNGTQTFYVNGVAHGAPNVGNATVPAGDIFGGSAPGTQPTYAGYLDELRISTFASGAFSTNDLLTRSLSPNILSPPQSASVWSGGAAPFTVSVAFDTSTTYLWQRNGGNIGGATSSEYYLNTVGAGDTLAQFDCVLNNYTGLAQTSSVATLTVVAPNPSNIAAYHDAVTAEPSLVAYYPIDNDTGATLTDIKGAHNGSLEGTAEYDGRIDRAFGVRALRLKNTADGDVTIPNNPAFEFVNGNGTVEAIVHLEPATAAANETIFAEAGDGGVPLYYAIKTSPDGSSLIYADDNTNLTWAVSPPILGRQAHVAVVFANTTVTAFVDGLSLGAKPLASFGNSPGYPAWIGSISTNTAGALTGTIDEVAVYTNALSANTIAIHNSKFLFGTNTAPPTITGLPGTGSKTLLAGGSASFTVNASGTAPLSYQWTTNGTPIPGANSASLTLSPTTISQSSPTYGVTVSNPYGFTNSPTFGLTFVAASDHYATVVMGDNPLAYWRLDETNGTTAVDSAGGHDGTFSGSYTLGATGAVPGSPDTGVHFTGGNAEVPFAAALNPSTAFTVEFWAKPDDVANTYDPLSSQFRGSSAREGWTFYMENDADSWETHLGNAAGVSLYCYGGGGPLVAGSWYHIVEVWDGAGNSTLYSEHQVVGHNSQVANGGTYVPNPSASLMIGVRNGGALAFNGVIDEVAIYNYAFTEEQVSNHWSIKFQTSAIVTQPVGVTNVEGSTVTLTAVASGFPNTYQWYQGASALADVLNPDGTQHYPQDVTNQTLVIAQSTPSDSGFYHLVVSNPLGGSQTLDAKVLITLDTNKPTVVSVAGIGTPNPTLPSAYLVKVLFNKRIDPVTGGDFHNYSIPGATVNGVTLLGDVRLAALGGDWRAAIVTTTGLIPGTTYNLTVTGVKDQTVTGNTIAPVAVPFKAPVMTQSNLVWDYYYLGSVVGGIAALQSDTNYPNAPQATAYLTAFNSGQITGDNLQNNPAFGALGDNYGSSVSGWITPIVTDDYTFFLSSDDASELYLSTDATPANAALIAFETTCCHPFTEPPVDTTSAPQHLTGGVPYFIRALQVDGGGGDYVRVAWRASGDTNAAASLTPISGAVLSAFVPGPAPVFSPVSYNSATHQLTISWTGTGRLYESTDLVNWTLVPGNPPSPYTVNVTTGPQKFYRVGP